MTIQTSRRAVLAGAPAIALVATIPGTLNAAPSALRGEWDAALARLQAATQAAEDFDAQTFYPLYNHELAVESAGGVDRSKPGWWRDRNAFVAEHRDGHRVPKEFNDRHEELRSLVGDAQSDVLRTPAPTYRPTLSHRQNVLAAHGPAPQGRRAHRQGRLGN